MAEQKNLGYDDTLVIPGSTYKVHDGTRPQPRVVTPAGIYGQYPPLVNACRKPGEW